LKQRIETDGSIRELHSLSQTFNDMAESLRKSDEAKKAFIADVTHELRTPLTVIKGTIETLEDGALDDVEGRGPLLTSMQRETDRLIRLVNELLVLTRADAGSLQLNMQTLNLAELAKARCEVFSGVAARKGIVLNCLVDDRSTPRVEADPDRVSQVINNLLDNAIRHSPDNSTINITIRPIDDGVECSVQDHGTGIPAEHLPFIFERFYRVDASRSRNDSKDGGTGLGLAIARALVNAQGGQIRAESVEGQRTTITFWLPTT
jgi:signal transduction histidine kinase